jgi:hypothetical protein
MNDDIVPIQLFQDGVTKGGAVFPDEDRGRLGTRSVRVQDSVMTEAATTILLQTCRKTPPPPYNRIQHALSRSRTSITPQSLLQCHQNALRRRPSVSRLRPTSKLHLPEPLDRVCKKRLRFEGSSQKSAVLPVVQGHASQQPPSKMHPHKKSNSKRTRKTKLRHAMRNHNHAQNLALALLH